MGFYLLLLKLLPLEGGERLGRRQSREENVSVCVCFAKNVLKLGYVGGHYSKMSARQRKIAAADESAVRTYLRQVS